MPRNPLNNLTVITSCLQSAGAELPLISFVSHLLSFLFPSVYCFSPLFSFLIYSFICWATITTFTREVRGLSLAQYIRKTVSIINNHHVVLNLYFFWWPLKSITVSMWKYYYSSEAEQNISPWIWSTNQRVYLVINSQSAKPTEWSHNLSLHLLWCTMQAWPRDTTRQRWHPNTEVLWRRPSSSVQSSCN